MASKPSPVPKRFRTITPHLVVQNSHAAIEFYKAAFSASETSRMVAPGGDQVVHAELKIGNSIVFLCDENPALGLLSPVSVGGSPASNHLYVADVDDVWSQAIMAGAVETSPLEDTYWGDRLGCLVDPFGHRWTLASRMEVLKVAEVAERARTYWGVGEVVEIAEDLPEAAI